MLDHIVPKQNSQIVSPRPERMVQFGSENAIADRRLKRCKGSKGMQKLDTTIRVPSSEFYIVVTFGASLYNRCVYCAGSAS